VLRKLRRIVILVLVAVVAFYVLLVGAVFFAQRKLVFPAPPDVEEPAVAGATLLRLPSGDGTVYALHLPAPEGAPTIVYFHSNGEQLADSRYLAQALHRQGFGFYSVEYPGYGLARSGAPSESGIYAAAEAALVHLEGALHVPRERIILVGRSLGSGVATEMAARGHGAKLALVSPYTSIADVGAQAFPFLPVRLLVRDRFDTLSKAARIALPVLLLHGSEDEVIPVAMSWTLSKRFPKATVRLVLGAQHNDVLEAQAGLGLRLLTEFSRDG